MLPYLLGRVRHRTLNDRVGSDDAVEQRDAADEGRLEARGSIMIGQLIVGQGEVVRPSQLIASVLRTLARAWRARRT